MIRAFALIKKIFLKIWFILLIIIILIVAYIGWFATQNLIPAIVLTAICLTLFVLYSLWRLIRSKGIEKSMKEYYRIDDKTLAKTLGRPFNDIQEKMFELSQKQSNKPWLIIYLNKQYIFYHEVTIEAFNKLYNKGFGDKEILDKLKRFELETRAEIKAIEEVLLKNDRLIDRELSVKERREKERFEKI